jgi:predicted HAD superfamily Cof-like phosphohydrolase
LQHKKQAFDHIERTVRWNVIRGNTTDTLNWDLEISMLQEELDELKEAVKNNNPVGIFDALMDIEFVLRGTCGKFGLTPEQQVDGYEAVIEANEAKSSKKNKDGKIMKPDNWEQYAPETKLQELLNKVQKKEI